ncbi:MAG: heavy-metal-associated domain-containing protein [Salana multivorans]|nr:heavy-metal-associated domain-containing protein [Salana multivorans]
MSTITTVDVTGMTCGHCVSAVTQELEALDGVGNVTVNLDAGGTSHVTVFSDGPLAEDAVRGAIDEAGYDVAGLSTRGAAEEFNRLADVRDEVAGVGPQAVEIISKDEATASEPAGEAGGCGCGGCGCGA